MPLRIAMVTGHVTARRGGEMAPESRGREKIAHLIAKGADIRSPSTVDIGDDVDVDRISAAITVFPGCRIYGAQTVISPGAELGREAPVTIDDCRLGPKVELKGGYFRESVFLDEVRLGSGAQVREGCLLEEEACGAHCVGLKQTILFPFVTLGSLINFCDCLMAGGTSRSNHSEVGSSYIHFNYTPDGDKATPSLFGDVPRGVMLNQRPIFLGGQGGAVGPLRLGFGTVAVAGSVLRKDVLEDGQLVSAPSAPGFMRDHHPNLYRNLARVVRNNLVYLANLVALEQWYERIRQPFFLREELGPLVYAGALHVLGEAREERVSRLRLMVEKLATNAERARQLRDRLEDVCRLFDEDRVDQAAAGESFARAVASMAVERRQGYVETIRSLPEDIVAAGVNWLESIVDELTAEAASRLPALEP
jgi:bifunctional UDP-N-acetylglucosamine pyrophosphorylase/glucosamine-1-phosphate N-acetyltransferase